MNRAGESLDGGTRGAARRAARIALSDMFLDTALDDGDINAIVRRLRETGLPVEELRHIYETEVAPVCSGNLSRLPGGVSSGFDPTWLEDAVRRHLETPPPLGGWAAIRRWRIGRWTASTRDHWIRIERLLAQPERS